MAEQFMQLIADLSSSNKMRRTKAAVALGNQSDIRCVGNLLKLLDDSWGPAVSAAYESIIRLKNFSATMRAYQEACKNPLLPEIWALKSLAGIPPTPSWKEQGMLDLDNLTNDEQFWLKKTLTTAMTQDTEQKTIAIIGLSHFVNDDEIRQLIKTHLNEKDIVFCSSLQMSFPLLGFPQVTIKVGEIAALYLILGNDEETAKSIFDRLLQDWWIPAVWPEKKDQNPKDKLIRVMYDQGWDWVIDKLAEYQSQPSMYQIFAVKSLAGLPDKRALVVLQDFQKSEEKEVMKAATRAINSMKTIKN